MEPFGQDELKEIGALYRESLAIGEPSPEATQRYIGEFPKQRSRVNRIGMWTTASAGLTLFTIFILLALGFASTNALPDDVVTYPIKRAVENVQITLAQSQSDKASLHVKFAKERATEAKQLIAEGNHTAAMHSLNEYHSEIAAASDIIGTFPLLGAMDEGIDPGTGEQLVVSADTLNALSQSKLILDQIADNVDTPHNLARAADSANANTAALEYKFLLVGVTSQNTDTPTPTDIPTWTNSPIKTLPPINTPPHSTSTPMPTVSPPPPTSTAISYTPTKEIVTVPTPTNLPTGLPTNIPTNQPTQLPTQKPTKESGNTPVPTEEPTQESPAWTPTASPSLTPMPSPSPSPSNVPTLIPTNTETSIPTDTPTNTPSLTDTATPYPTFTPQPTDTATEEPTLQPTDVPTDTPTDIPTDIPTDPPTLVPTDIPTDIPIPTDEPTIEIMVSPTDIPTDEPTARPTDTPTDSPTDEAN